MAEQVRPQLLNQYREAGFNFVLLHKWDDLRTHIKLKNGKTKELATPIELGKAPKEKEWTIADVSYQKALEHIKAGRNVGVQMSSAGYAVIDYDPRNDPKAGTAENALDKLLKDADLKGVKHAIVTTGSMRGPVRGCHIYVKVDPEWRGRTKLEETTKYPGVEFKHSPGQQVVAAGSVHPSGGLYHFDEESVPLTDAQEATAKLLEIFEHKKPPQALRGTGAESWGAYDPEDIAKALKHVPVDKYHRNHDKWLELMMAVHWATGGEAGDEFVDWCVSDPEYADDGDMIRERWDSFVAEPGKDTGFIKAGTMFKHFIDAEVPEDCMPRMRVEVMFDHMEPEDWEYDMAPLSEERLVLQKMNRDHAVIAAGRDPLFLKPGINLVTGEAGDYELVTKAVMTALYANKQLLIKKIVGDGKVSNEEIDYFNFWYKHPERRTYNGIIYKPSVNSPDVHMSDGQVYYNEFRGWPYSRHERGRGEWTLFRELIYEVLASGNDEWYDYIIKWMAYSIQNPEHPQGVMLVFQGAKGIGKSIVLERWKRCFGSGGMTTQRMDDLIGNYNAGLRRCSALLLEEGLWAGDKKGENVLKHLITGESVQTEAKFQNAQETANHLAIAMATNNQWAVPATPDERRFAVFEAKQKWAKNHPHFGKIVRQMDYEGGMQAFFYDLLHMDLEGWHPRAAIPMTPALRAQIATTAGAVAQWWGRLLSKGELPTAMGADSWGYTPADWPQGRVAVLYNELKNSFRRTLGEKPPRKWISNFDKTFAYELKQLLPGNDMELKVKKTPSEVEEFQHHEPALSQGRDKYLILPDLQTCKSYAAAHGIEVEIDDVDEGFEQTNEPEEPDLDLI